MKTTMASGPEYLGLVTTLAQRVRLEHPTAGLWEGADLQWWWRRDRPSDHLGQLFWIDDTGGPEAAVVLTDWGRTWGCDPIVLPSMAETMLPVIWSQALQRIDELSLDSVEIIVRDDDEPLQELVAESGFEPAGGSDVTLWMAASDRRPITTLAAGFSLHDRGEARDRPHHMISRNGEIVAERLSQTSLYRPDLDLWVEDSEGEVAAYGLFWWDPGTGVGLVEPMRTEQPYWRMGLARHLLTNGLDRLAKFGASRLKVSYETDNPAARELYLSCRFRPESTSRTFRRQR
jgi:hypothetical protein